MPPSAPSRSACPIAFAALLFVLAARTSTAQLAAFTDVTTPEMQDNLWGEGVTWGDYDGDGDLDLLVANEGQFLRLFRNDGGTLVLATPSGMSFPGNWTGIAWGDYDNDGDIDLFAAEAERPKHVFRNDGGGVFVDFTPPALATDSVHTHGVCWVDYDRDGDVDLFCANAFDGERLWRNDGGGNLVDVSPAVLNDPQYGRGCSFADYDDDGDPDLCIANFGTSRLYRNDGGVFVDVTGPPIDSPGHGGGVAWGDYDNDGDFDLFIAKAFSATNRLYRNNGNGTFTDVTTPVLAPVQNCIGVQWGDYDNDADLDLYVGNFDGPNFLFRNDGGGVFTNVANPALADTHSTIGVAWADDDGDGDLDLYVANNAGEPDRMLRNDTANGNHWLEIDLVGTQSNRSGIDSKVEVFTGGVRQVRRVEGGGGYNSQSALRLHYGLGASTVVDSIKIRWSCGVRQDTTVVAVDQVLSIRERSTVLAVDPRPRAGPVSLAIAPNPVRSRATLRMVFPWAVTVSVMVTDTQGRAVRSLARGESYPAGTHTLEWDGADYAGRRVRPGVYWVRLTAADAVVGRRIVRLD